MMGGMHNVGDQLVPITVDPGHVCEAPKTAEPGERRRCNDIAEYELRRVDGTRAKLCGRHANQLDQQRRFRETTSFMEDQ